MSELDTPDDKSIVHADRPRECGLCGLRLPSFGASFGHLRSDHDLGPAPDVVGSTSLILDDSTDVPKGAPADD